MRLRIIDVFFRFVFCFTVWWSLVVFRSSAQVSDISKQVGHLFMKQKSCPGKIVSLENCPEAGSDGLITRCAVLCSQQSSCAAFLWDLVQMVCHLCSALIPEDCMNSQDRGMLEAYEKILECDLGWWSHLNRCQCFNGVIGNLCQRTMRDCEDWGAEGFPDGVYWIQPSRSQAAFRVMCGMKYNRSYVLSSEDPAFNFYRGWNEYSNGFGDLESDHWLGLKHISILTASQRYSLTIEWILANFSYYQTWYEPVTVADESRNYTIKFDRNYVTSKKNSLGDCLTDVNGQAFSTHDADHDNDHTTNCALRHQSGWWMGSNNGSGCTLCNPTGHLLSSPDMKWSGRDEDVFWRPFGDGTFTAQSIGMWLERCR